MGRFSQMRGADASGATPVLPSAANLAMLLLEKFADQVAPFMRPFAEIIPTRAVVLNQVATAANTTSANITVIWPTDGILFAIRATNEDGLDTSMAGTLLRVQVDGNTDLFSSGTGNGAGYIPFSQISGSTSSFGRYQITRRFRQANNWLISIQNTTGSNVVSDLTFDILDVRNPQPE
jgi:hypothetical protein